MLSRAVTRVSPVLRIQTNRSYSSFNSKVLGRIREQSSHIHSPLAPLQIPISLFQSRSFAKDKNKKPLSCSPPSQSSNSAVESGPKSTSPSADTNATQNQQAVEPATIPNASRAAAITEGGIDGTELPSEFPNVSESQAESEGIARTQTGKQLQPGQPASVNSSDVGPENASSARRDGSVEPGPQASEAYSSSALDTSDVHGEAVSQQKSPRPLPDLTQGIPSTLDEELAQSSQKSDSKGLNVTEDTSEFEGGSGALPRSAYISSFERRRNRFANYFYAFTLLTAVSSTIYLGRNWETEEEERVHKDAPNGWGLGLFYNRVSARLSGTLDYYNEPAFPKLLPNTDPAWERPYTLVLSLEDLLVHSEWDREHGWRMAKRPGADYFLRYLSQYYELVIFTSVPSMIGQPIINKLDPYHIVMWPLFREATRYKKGEYIKDLSYLNRPLNRIILLDTNPAHAKLQPENAIITKKWKGDTQDKELVSFIPFLEYVASMEFNDIRDVLRSFEGTHIPSEYAKREAVAREKFMQQMTAEKAKSRGGRSMSGLGGLLGMRSHGVGMDGMEQTLSEGFAQGKTFQDQVRERGQKQYEMLEKEIRENGEKWLKEMAAEEKKMNEEAMKGMKNSITGVFPFGVSGAKTSSSSPASQNP